jgi:hypothetical protein
VSTTLVLVIVLVFSFVVGRLLHRLRERFVLPTLGLYLLVGLGVGPLGLDVVDGERLVLLQPVLSLLLGLVGFVLGLGLRRRFSEAKGLEAGVLGGAFTAAAVGGAGWGIAWLLGVDAVVADAPWALVGLGALAAVSDSDVIAHLADRASARGPVRQLLQAMALAGSVVAVSVFGLSLALARAKTGGAALGLTPVEWLLAALAVGVGCGLLFHLFVGKWEGSQRTFLATVAVITFASGMAAGLDISPLLVGLVAGATVSVVSAEARELATVMENLEAPATVAILVLAGAMWVPPALPGWAVVAGALLLRPAALRLGAWGAPRAIGGLPTGHRLGQALLPQGGLGIAIAVNLTQVFPVSGQVVLTAAMVGLVVYDVMGYAAVRRVLADAGEVVHQAAGRVAAPVVELAVDGASVDAEEGA